MDLAQKQVLLGVRQKLKPKIMIASDNPFTEDSLVNIQFFTGSSDTNRRGD